MTLAVWRTPLWRRFDPLYRTHFVTCLVTFSVSALLHVVRAEQTPVVLRPGFCFGEDRIAAKLRLCPRLLT